MTTSRRGFLTLLSTLVVLPSCASLKVAAPPPPGSRRASISGYVFGRGLRFGRTTERNPSGQYPTTFVVPNTAVWLYERETPFDAEMDLIRRVQFTKTDNQGYYTFENLEPGHYYVYVRGARKAIKVINHTDTYAGLFQTY
jgi:hypothetical protein